MNSQTTCQMDRKRSYNEISGGETEHSESKKICTTDNSSSSSQQEVETFPEAGTKMNDLAGHGNRFQSKLLILYAVRAIQLKYEFYLGTELSVGEKFDDLIFYYKENGETFRRQYLQAKHKLNENACITADQLIYKDKPKEKLKDKIRDKIDTGEFSLLKYFQSYIKMRSNKDDIEHCIICTNVDFDQNDLQINRITSEPVAKEKWPKLLDCTNVEPQQSCYKLKIAYDKFDRILFERKKKWIENFTKNDIKYLFENCPDEKIKSLFFNCPQKVNGKPFHTAAEIKNLLISFKDLKEMYLTNFFQNCDKETRENIVSAVFEGFFFFLDDFLNKLVFAVKMPNEEELDPILTKEVGDYFKLSNAKLPSDSVMNELINWFKNQTKNWLTAEDGKRILEEKVGILMKLGHITSDSMKYQDKKLKKDFVKFDDEVVRQLIDILEEFWDSQEKIKRIKSETPKLTAVKVISAIQKMPRFPNDDDYLVFSSKKLKENVNELEESKRAEKCHHLFVIVDDDAENPLENDTSYQNSIPLDMKKKVIVISKNVSPGDSGDPITFGKFHEDTKNKIKNTEVLFQGIDKTVGDLIKESQLENELDSKFIDNLLYAENETNSVPSFNSGFNPSLYIQRTLKFPQEDQLLNKLAEAMDDKEIDTINDGSMDRYEEKRGNKGDETKTNEKENKKVKDEIRIDSNGKIHWLIDDDKRKKEIWEKLQFLLENNNSSLLKPVNEGELIDANKKRVIITDVAGTGKSTILSHCYEEIKKANPDKLVIKISLMNYSKALMNEKSINEFLINNVMDQNAFARQLLKHRLETGDRIILMLDGFDEIDSECQSKVVELVKTLNDSIPLYITTRPHLADKLQFELSQLAYSLEKFTKNDQINYLTDVWKEYLKEVSYNEEIIKKFAKDLIKRVSETLKDKEKEFIGIPLQCRILAESFQSKIKDEIIRPDPNADLSHLIEGQQFDLVHLYESLINEKRKVFRKEKIEENSRQRHIINYSIEYIINKTERHLQKLAVQIIVNQQEDVNILIPYSAGFQSEFEKKKKEKKFNEFGIRLGLVDAKGENGIEFLHRTYAEYLVADYVFNGFLLDEEKHNKLLENEPIRNWIIEQMLVEDNYEGVRVFFDSMLKEIILKEEWKSRIQNNHLPLRLQQFATFLSSGEDKIWPFDRSFVEINSNISLLIFDCLDVTFRTTPSKIPSLIFISLRNANHFDPYKEIVNIFVQKIDVFDQLLNYFDNADNKDLYQFTKVLIHELIWEKQQIENEILERFLVFVGRHVEKDSWDFQQLTFFFIHSKMEEQTREQFFKILTSKYSTDFELTEIMKNARKKSLIPFNFPIGEIEKALTILRDLGRINVAGELSRWFLFRKFETLKKEGNTNVRLSLEKMGMTGLHGAAFKGDLSLIEKEIGCSLQNPENCSKEEKKSVLQLMTNEEDSFPPLYFAAAYGHDDICQKIFRFLDLKKDISDEEGFLHRSLFINSFLHRSLEDAIEYENVVMIHTILKCVKESQGQNDLVKLLQSVINMISNMYNLNKMQVEMIISVFVQDTENGHKDLNDLVFYNQETLRILEQVECDVLQKMITAAGGLDNWIKRLIDTDLEFAFEVLSSKGFLGKLNQENQISQLIDILITKSTLDDNQPSGPLTSYWSNFVKEKISSSDMRDFLEAISKCASEEDLERLLLYRDDNDVLILLQFFIIEGRDEFIEILTDLPENLRKEIGDLSEEEKTKLIDHFFSAPTFLESLDCFQQFNVIKYYLENGNEKQLAKFSQVVQVHQLEKALRWDKEEGKKIAGLLKEKLDSKTVVKYNEIIVKYST